MLQRRKANGRGEWAVGTSVERTIEYTYTNTNAAKARGPRRKVSIFQPGCHPSPHVKLTLLANGAHARVAHHSNG